MASETKGDGGAQARVWPACVYMDGSQEVALASEAEDPGTRCPPSWAIVILEHKRQGKHPYMYEKLSARSQQGAFARAFRNFMSTALEDGLPAELPPSP
jgi:hypothetical protein